MGEGEVVITCKLDIDMHRRRLKDPIFGHEAWMITWQRPVERKRMPGQEAPWTLDDFTRWYPVYMPHNNAYNEWLSWL